MLIPKCLNSEEQAFQAITYIIQIIVYFGSKVKHGIIISSKETPPC